MLCLPHDAVQVLFGALCAGSGNYHSAKLNFIDLLIATDVLDVSMREFVAVSR